MVDYNYYQSYDFLIWTDLTLSAQEEVIALSLLVCSVDDMLGAIHTPIILEACNGGVRLIFGGDFGVLRKRSALFSDRRHFSDVSYFNSSRYHLVFLTLV